MRRAELKKRFIPNNLLFVSCKLVKAIYDRYNEKQVIK